MAVPTDDGLQIRPKHVEVDWRNKLGLIARQVGFACTSAWHFKTSATRSISPIMQHHRQKLETFIVARKYEDRINICVICFVGIDKIFFLFFFFPIFCWPCISIYLFININHLDALNFIISLFQASTCFEHMCLSSGRQNVLYSLWYHHTYRWPSRAQIERGCIVQFWPPDDKHMCSKHVEAWNKLIIKFSASSWFILINKYIQMHGQQNINKLYINKISKQALTLWRNVQAFHIIVSRP